MEDWRRSAPRAGVGDGRRPWTHAPGLRGLGFLFFRCSPFSSRQKDTARKPRVFEAWRWGNSSTRSVSWCLICDWRGASLECTRSSLESHARNSGRKNMEVCDSSCGWANVSGESSLLQPFQSETYYAYVRFTQANRSLAASLASTRKHILYIYIVSFSIRLLPRGEVGM